MVNILALSNSSVSSAYNICKQFGPTQTASYSEFIATKSNSENGPENMSVLKMGQKICQWTFMWKTTG